MFAALFDGVIVCVVDVAPFVDHNCSVDRTGGAVAYPLERQPLLLLFRRFDNLPQFTKLNEKVPGYRQR